MFSYMTAGESHGPALVGILDGIPSHLRLDVAAVNQTLARRQGGYGRSARMKIERDEIEFLAGVRGGVTLGSPIAILVRNRDYETPKVRALMDPISGGGVPLTNPRPGHAPGLRTAELHEGTRDQLNPASRVGHHLSITT